MLARQDLIRAWKRGEIRFEPDISPDQISLSSVDLRLGRIFTKLKAHKHLVIRPAQDFDPSGFVRNTTFRSGQIFRLRPKEFRLGQTLERITLPATLAAHIHGRSSLARSGLAVHSTAPHIHPGFYGPITLELFNYGEWNLEFSAGKDVRISVPGAGKRFPKGSGLGADARVKAGFAVSFVMATIMLSS